MQREISVCATPTMMLEMRKDYPDLTRAVGVDDLPDGWTANEIEQDFTVTLFVFSWALLPVGFMVLMAISSRYAQHRITLATAALVMLVLAFWTGAGQRRSSLHEPRMQLAVASLATSALCLGLLWGLDMEAWWWVAYGLIFGTVATMYVGLNHLASCNAPTLSIPWSTKTPLPLHAMSGWGIQNGRWTNGRMGLFRFEHGGVCTLYGSVDGEVTSLCLEPLLPLSEVPALTDWGLDFVALRDASLTSLSEE